MTRLQFLGKNIKKYRLENHFSQEFLAENATLAANIYQELKADKNMSA